MRSGLKNTLLQKLFFYIFHSFFSLSSLQRGTPPKVFFGKTVWGRRKEPYVFLKPTPTQKRMHPHPVYAQRPVRNSGSSHHIAPPPPALFLEGNCC